MAQLENGNAVTLQELMVSTFAMTDALAKLLIEKKRPHHGRGVQAEAAGGAGGLSAHSQSDNAMIISSYPLRDRLQCSNRRSLRDLRHTSTPMYMEGCESHGSVFKPARAGSIIEVARTEGKIFKTMKAHEFRTGKRVGGQKTVRTLGPLQAAGSA
jgi:hypothetical protein